MKTADLSSGAEIAIFENLLAGVREAGISLTNGFEAVDVELTEPTLDDTMPDNERLTWALEEATGCKISLPFFALAKLPAVLRENGFRVRVWGERKDDRFTVFDLTAYGDEGPLCGLGVDIGTTTVTAVLLNWKAASCWQRPAAATDRFATVRMSSTALSSRARPAVERSCRMPS
jgi:hypothetical protein